MKKAMISQPMNGKTDEEIKTSREKAKLFLKICGYEFVNTLFTDEWYKESMKKRGVRQIPLSFLAKSIENMSLCDVVYFCDGWEKARGCKIEHDIAMSYGLKIIYEEDPIVNDYDHTAPTNNYDRITSMSVKQLAEFIDVVGNSPCICCNSQSCTGESGKKCRSEIENYLKSKVAK